jgi:hypothetical protein
MLCATFDGANCVVANELAELSRMLSEVNLFELSSVNAMSLFVVVSG